MQKIHLSSSCSLSSLLDSKCGSHPSSSCCHCFSSAPCILSSIQLCTMYTVLFSALCHVYCSVSALHHVYCSHFLPCSFSLQVLQDYLDVLQCDSCSFSVYGIEVGWYHFLVSALHHGYCFCCFFCNFFMMYTARQTGCPLA